MARIKTVSPEAALGIRKLAVWQAKRQYGYVPGILKIGLVDLSVGRHLGAVYDTACTYVSPPRWLAFSERCSPSSSTAM